MRSLGLLTLGVPSDVWSSVWWRCYGRRGPRFLLFGSVLWIVGIVFVVVFLVFEVPVVVPVSIVLLVLQEFLVHLLLADWWLLLEISLVPSALLLVPEEWQTRGSQALRRDHCGVVSTGLSR